ncbi:hypothetical protein DM01DRAFT_1332171 [Hesseltinella vesiculosa]|uniref:Glucosidase II subunit alpha n=1 Tax=Hesseltinella vesiculosa TaxID=101127 RepID=A0A1X2GU67_9FUNG|nr:hypothetical protein DM01DRAFT_1332171 [Hesseltinella vesiculosa]
MPFSSRQRIHLYLLGLLLFGSLASAMKTEDFKTCSQSGFCQRNRLYADDAAALGDAFRSPYAVDADSLHLSLEDTAHITADIINKNADKRFTMALTFLQDNTVRVQMNEKDPLHPRFDAHAAHTLVKAPVAQAPQAVDRTQDNQVTMILDASRKVIVTLEPVKVDFLVNDASVITLNDRGFFNFEHLRTKESHKPKMIQQQNDDGTLEDVQHAAEDTMWEETFKSWTDPKPNGPESIALDISFNGFSHVYGIPEHASTLSLKETRGGDNAYTEPYRLYNTDVFEYALDSPTSLYGAIPFMTAHRKDLSAGIFWMNPSETWIDIVKTKSSKNSLAKLLDFGKKEVTTTQTHWMSEAGVLDLFVFLGPTAKDVLRQYTSLTGTPALPQQFAIGYHQCRWNYINQKDVLEVDQKFDEFEMPYDVIWLDIEYTVEKKYFTWDNTKFPDPIAMEKQLDDKGRQLVAIVDPHIKRADDFPVFEVANKDHYFVQKPTGGDYEGWCWPGQSSWPDFFDPKVCQWWQSLFAFDKFVGTRENVHIWHDMNEPSIFNGPEITMQKEMIHHGNWEHRNLHNLYGLLSFAATSEGVRTRTKVPKRPFVLSRSFYAGAQRYGAVWTGDNMADWDSLAMSMPMILSSGLGGMPFNGADVPGFFGNPGPELLARWYQTGVFQPFFRGHAHIDTKRREPYLVDEPYRSITRKALRTRYALLPYWYTLFYDAFKTGTPMMRPMFMEFPQEEQIFAMEDQFMVGDSILVKPITTEQTTSTDVYFPGEQPWYDLETYQPIYHHGYRTVDAPLEKIPAYYRGGRIIPRRERPRRSSAAMALDPFTLMIALDKKSNAEGTLYLDDGESYDYEAGTFAHTHFVYNKGILTCDSLHADGASAGAQAFAKKMSSVRVERLVLMGTHRQPNRVQLLTKQTTLDLAFSYHEAVSSLEIRDPAVSVVECDWTIRFDF